MSANWRGIQRSLPRPKNPALELATRGFTDRHLVYRAVIIKHTICLVLLCRKPLLSPGSSVLCDRIVIRIPELFCPLLCGGNPLGPHPKHTYQPSCDNRHRSLLPPWRFPNYIAMISDPETFNPPSRPSDASGRAEHNGTFKTAVVWQAVPSPPLAD
ncbi:hypothetical protein VTK26DRAFT_3350 [Humicola hyalothermophila]